MTLFLHYGAPDPQTGQNPNWKTFGYPGPISAPPQVEKPLKIHEPEGSEETIEADVCIVGSGSGGSVVAAVLAARGLDVVVLEAAGYYNESDFTQLELPAYQQMFWRGGPTPTADGNVSLVAGTTLGGGTTINWTNCLRTRPWVREQWAGARARGRRRPGVRPPSRRGLERISANDGCSDLNGTQQRLREGDRGARLELRDDRAQHRSGRATRRRWRATSASATSRAASRAPTAPGSPTRRSTAPGSSPTPARRAFSIEGGRAAGVEAVWQTPGRPRRPGHRSGTARGRRLRLARVAGAAAALGDRRPGGRPQPAAASLERRRRRLRHRPARPGGGRRRPGSATSSPTPARATAS